MEIMIVSSPDTIDAIAKLLASGQAFDCNFYFRVQEQPLGIPDGIRLLAKRQIIDIIGNSVYLVYAEL